MAKNYGEKTRPPPTRIFSSIPLIIKEPQSDDLVSCDWRLTRHFNPLGSPEGYLGNKVKLCQPKMEFASNTFTLVRV